MNTQKLREMSIRWRADGSPYLQDCADGLDALLAKYGAEDAARVEVTEGMVTRAIDAQPYVSRNSAVRVWQLFADPDAAPEAIRAALTAALKEPE